MLIWLLHGGERQAGIFGSCFNYPLTLPWLILPRKRKVEASNGASKNVSLAKDTRHTKGFIRTHDNISKKTILLNLMTMQLKKTNMSDN